MDIYLPSLEAKMIELVFVLRFIVFAILVGGLIFHAAGQKSGEGIVKTLAKAIVKHMVAMFNTALKNFAAGQSAVVYVDVRPAMTGSDWLSDEIHPRKSGAEKIAALLREAIAKNNLVA